MTLLGAASESSISELKDPTNSKRPTRGLGFSQVLYNYIYIIYIIVKRAPRPCTWAQEVETAYVGGARGLFGANAPGFNGGGFGIIPGSLWSGARLV